MPSVHFMHLMCNGYLPSVKDEYISKQDNVSIKLYRKENDGREISMTFYSVGIVVVFSFATILSLSTANSTLSENNESDEQHRKNQAPCTTKDKKLKYIQNKKLKTNHRDRYAKKKKPKFKQAKAYNGKL